MAITIVDVEKLQRSCELLLRDLGLALEKALMAFAEPRPAAATFRTRLQALVREADRIGLGEPSLKPVAKAIVEDTRKRMDDVVDRADRASKQRGKVDGRFQTQYNQVVGQAIADLPQQGTALLHQQIEKQIGGLLDQVFPAGKVPGDVRNTMARELSRWVSDQDAVEDAFYLVQRQLSSVAVFLQDRLTIHAELVSLRDSTASRDKITPGQANQADARAGQLAERAVQLDEKIQQVLQQSGVGIEGVAKLNPQLVLDPTRRFLARLDAQAGIKIKRDQVTVELGTRLQIVNPLMFDRSTGVQVQPYLGVNVGQNLQLGATYQNTWKAGSWSGSEVKASLTWRF